MSGRIPRHGETPADDKSRYTYAEQTVKCVDTESYGIVTRSSAISTKMKICIKPMVKL